MNTNKTIKLIHNHIDDIFPAHLRKAQEFLRMPSISAENIGLIENARWIKSYLESLGGQVKLTGRAEFPIVFARFELNRPKTLLIYGMYDVQPVEGQAWSSPPFEAEIHEVQGTGPCIIARGACNSKGPLIGFLNALQGIKQVDEIPVNIIMTIEGEEEIGSPTLASFYKENKNLLKADAGFDPFWSEYGTDVNKPTIALGSKGILCLELVCRGGEWGGPKEHPVHSSTGAWIASPLWRLIKALNTLIGQDDEIMVEGIYDKDLQLSQEDEYLLSKLEITFSEADTLKLIDSHCFKHDLHGKDLLRQYFFSPSISINRLPQGNEDVIPAESRVQITIRLVPGMDPDQTMERIHRHLIVNGYPDIEVARISGYPSSRTSLNEKVVQSLLEAYRYHHREPQIWPLLTGANPYYLFSDVLGIPFAWGGLGQAGRNHEPDEYASVEGLKLFEKSIVTFLYNFADS